MNTYRDNRSYRGVLQSDDGVITTVLRCNAASITFQSAFGLSDHMIDRLKRHPEHILFSERSRLARLGIQITCDLISSENLTGDILTVTQTASLKIPGYPGLDLLKKFFDPGFPVGRLVFCDPATLLSSEEVMAAIEKSELKLPASTSISSDGSIVITPHKVVCDLTRDIDKETLGRILLRPEGREILNRYQVARPVPSVSISPGEGVVTTCSMYLSDHYVVLQSGHHLGRNLPATVLDPIKTRGIRIYLEIVNNSEHPIVNPLIYARVYGVPRDRTKERRKTAAAVSPFSFPELTQLAKRFSHDTQTGCHYLQKPVAVIEDQDRPLEKADILMNGPQSLCRVSTAECTTARRNYSGESRCAHEYATSKIRAAMQTDKAVIALRYFPNIREHRELVNLAFEGKIDALYFFEPSCEHGPFLSQQDHHRLEEYHAFGIRVFWACGLNKQLMVYTIRDGMGFFVKPERLTEFHKSMLFAFYGSTLALSKEGNQRFGALMDALVNFWGLNIGIVTGGGSGVMGVANAEARKRGILSGANFLEITDQPMTTDVDFCQVFQSTCRHSRQKWFEVASFPIFNVGGLGSLEELGITLCNMKLSIMERVPIVLFDTEHENGFWDHMEQQIRVMVAARRAPAWILDNIVITDDPNVVVAAYRERLQLF